MQRVIIIGATSGIGKALALFYINKGFLVGITGRREELLQELKANNKNQVFYKALDVTDIENSRQAVELLVYEMGGIPNIFIVNAGIGNYNKSYELEPDLETIDVNVRGFVSMMQLAYRLMKESSGVIAGISSASKYFGYGRSAAYTASKAFISNYMSGVRHRALIEKSNVSIVDIQPGFITTPMVEKVKVFMPISAERAAKIMDRAIEKRKRVAIIPLRWLWIVIIGRLLPESVLHKIS